MQVANLPTVGALETCMSERHPIDPVDNNIAIQLEETSEFRVARKHVLSHFDPATTLAGCNWNKCIGVKITRFDPNPGVPISE